MRAIESIQECVRARAYRISLHARVEMDKDNVTTTDLVHALLTANAEIIEDYPDDPRGHSHLVLGATGEGTPLHICCAVHEECLVIITVYRPDQALWTEDWRTRV